MRIQTETIEIGMLHLRLMAEITDFAMDCKGFTLKHGA